MESPFAPIAAYIPSQPHDRFHSLSSSGLNSPSEASLASSSFPAEPESYNTPQTLSPLASPFYVPRFGSFRFGFGDPSAQLPFMDGPRVPTTTPASDSPYNWSSDYGYLEPGQLLPSSQAGTSPPVTMQTYQNYNHLGAVPSRLPYIRPMPAEGLSENSPVALPHRPRISIELAVRTSNREPQPAHVVGSQGRRGILPSAVGRPAAVAGEIATGQKSTNMPAKDANGKYPCPHCVKTYLHAKHLKRHLLRHTGTRPYSCGLCKETFSRSDILKRHFQKCSVRRGNPTGQNHLTHSRATKKSNIEAAGKMLRGRAAILPLRTRSLPSGQDNGMGDIATNNVQDSFDFNALELVSPTYLEEQQQLPNGESQIGSPTYLEEQQPLPKRESQLGSPTYLEEQQPLINRESQLGSPAYLEEQQPLPSRESRSNSVRRPSTSGVAGNLSHLYGASSYDPTGFNYSGQITPDSISTSGAATPYQYHHELRANQFPSDASFTQGVPVAAAQSMPSGYGASFPQIVGSSHDRGNDLDWSVYFPARGLDNYAQLHHHTVDDSKSIYHRGDENQLIKMESDSHPVPGPAPRN